MVVAETPQLHTVAEIAETLRVSKVTVYRLIDRGELRAVRVGGSLRVDGRDLSGYLTRDDASNAMRTPREEVDAVPAGHP